MVGLESVIDLGSVSASRDSRELIVSTRLLLGQPSGELREINGTTFRLERESQSPFLMLTEQP